MAATKGKAKERCPWAGDDPLMVAYHDDEWGEPSRDDRHLLEMLILEGAQAGLSWSTILRKREGYRQAFAELGPGRDRALHRARHRPPARRRANRPQPPEGPRRDRQRPGLSDRYAKSLARSTRTSGSSWTASRSTADAATMGDVPATHAGVRGHEPRPQAARLPLRRPDDLLRVHAGRRHGQRPPGHLLLPRPTYPAQAGAVAAPAAAGSGRRTLSSGVRRDGARPARSI